MTSQGRSENSDKSRPLHPMLPNAEKYSPLTAQALRLRKNKKLSIFSSSDFFFSYNDFSFSTVTINLVWQFFVFDW